MTNDPLCLNAPEPARRPPNRAQFPEETSPVNSIAYAPSPPAQFSSAEEQPPPYQTPRDANEQSWQARVLGLLNNLAYAPARLLASTGTSQRAQFWLGLLRLGIGAYYYYESYLLSSRSLVLS
jgi:hypothetical protein